MKRILSIILGIFNTSSVIVAAKFLNQHAVGLSVMVAFLLLPLSIVQILVYDDILSASEYIRIFAVQLALLIIGNILLLIKIISLVKGASQSELKMRILKTFTVISAVPTLMVSIFSILFFDHSIKIWSNTQVKEAISRSLNVGEIYLKEHRHNLASYAIHIATKISNILQERGLDRDAMQLVLESQIQKLYINESAIFQNNEIIARSKYSFIDINRVKSFKKSAHATNNTVMLSTDHKESKVIAIIQIPHTDQDLHLVIGKLIDNEVLSHIDLTKKAEYSYRYLLTNMETIEMYYSILFICISLLITLLIICTAINLTDRILHPIITMLNATEQIARGNYEITTIDDGGNNHQDEIYHLRHAFKDMVQKLQLHREQLVATNHALNERRIYTENILANLSSGVILLNNAKQITLVNITAQLCLSLSEQEFNGRYLHEICPKMDTMLENACNSNINLDKHEEVIELEDMHQSLMVRCNAISFKHNNSIKNNGYIITFDNITHLIKAQKAAAWSEVGRIVAHEIRNPITPISLAAERIRKKYVDQISNEKEDFIRYIDIIIKHINHLGSIISEFSSSAQMPQYIFAKFDLCKLLSETMFTMRMSHNKIQYQYQNNNQQELLIKGDRTQLEMALLNIIKNANEAICSQYTDSEATSLDQLGTITISTIFNEDHDKVYINIIDDGPGFANAMLQNCVKPYNSSKENGRGIGLTIAKLIIDDHNGTISIANNSIGGAHITISLDIQ